MADKKNNVNYENNELYEYIKYVDEKVTQNDKMMKFITAQQSEQMKELIGSKANNLRNFFEEAIRLQTEIVRNAYEEIITELKNTYENDLKNREIEGLKLYNQKEEALKSAYESKIWAIKELAENDCRKKLDECYLNAKNEFEKEKEALIAEHIQEHQRTADKVYQDTKAEVSKEYENKISEILAGFEKEKTEITRKNETETAAIVEEYENKIAEITVDNEKKIAEITEENEDRIAEVNAWHNKNLQTKLHEQEDYFRKQEQQIADEAYANGKNDTESWHDDIVRQKLEEQAQYFQEELKNQSDRLKGEFERYLAVETEKVKAECESENIEKQKAVVNEVYNRAKAEITEEYEERIAEVNAWHNKNLQTKLQETEEYCKKQHEEIVRQKLETQAEYFKEEIERAKEETKSEMMVQMDEAARRNEEELKLFLDFYEAKIKSFKKFINIHETTDKIIKDIQQRLQRKFNKTFGDK